MYTFIARIYTGKQNLIGSRATLKSCLRSVSLIGVAVVFAFSAKLAVASEWYPQNWTGTALQIQYLKNMEFRYTNLTTETKYPGQVSFQISRASAYSDNPVVEVLNSSGTVVTTCYNNYFSTPAGVSYQSILLSSCPVPPNYSIRFRLVGWPNGNLPSLYLTTSTSSDPAWSWRPSDTDAWRTDRTPLISFLTGSEPLSYIDISAPASTTPTKAVNIPYTYFLSSNEVPSLSEFPFVFQSITSLAFDYDRSITYAQPITALDTVIHATTSLTASRSGTHLLVIGFWNGKDGSDSEIKFSRSFQLQIASSTVIDEQGFARAGLDEACSSTVSLIDKTLCRTWNWLFVPSEKSVGRITDFDSELKQRAPFAYVYDMKSVQKEFFGATSSQDISVGVTTSIGHIEFLSKKLITDVPYSSRLRTIMGWILWFMLCNYLYYRVLNIFSQKQV